MKDEKIFEDEMMSDEELEQVAGGNICQTSEDSKFLYEHGIIDKSYTDSGTMQHWDSVSKEVDKGWTKVGITCVPRLFGNNWYFMDDTEISRAEAMKIVAEKFPKIRD